MTCERFIVQAFVGHGSVEVLLGKGFTPVTAIVGHLPSSVKIKLRTHDGGLVGEQLRCLL